MGTAFHQLCPRYNGPLTLTAPMAVRLWKTLRQLETSIYPAVNGYLFRIREGQRMGTAFHQLCPRYNWPLTLTALVAVRLWKTLRQLETSIYPAVNGYLFQIREGQRMGSAFHQLCPRYNGPLTLTAPMAVRLWKTLRQLETSIYPAVNGYLFRIREGQRMGSAFHQLCPRYNGPLTLTALVAVRLWKTLRQLETSIYPAVNGYLFRIREGQRMGTAFHQLCPRYNGPLTLTALVAVRLWKTLRQLETSIYPAVNGYLFRIREGQRMGSAFQQLCPRYNGPLTLTALVAVRLWKTLRQLETSIYPAVNGYLFRIREGQRMGSAFHQLCPRYNGPLTLTALVAVRLWKTLRQLETSIYPAVNGYLFRIREGQRMGTAFHQLCPRYNGPLTLTALVAVRLWKTLRQLETSIYPAVNGYLFRIREGQRMGSAFHQLCPRYNGPLTLTALVAVRLWKTLRQLETSIYPAVNGYLFRIREGQRMGTAFHQLCPRYNGPLTLTALVAVRLWKTLRQLETSIYPAVNGYLFRIREGQRMGSAFHQLCPRYNGPLTLTALVAVRLWKTLRQLENSIYPAVNGYLFRIREGQRMGTAFHQLCPRYNGPLTLTAPMAVRLWKTLRQLETSIYPAVNGYLFRIREGQRMGSAFHQLCPRYNGPLTLTALVAVRLWKTLRQLETSIYPAVNGYLFRIREGQRMGTAFHQLCPRYNGPLTLTALVAVRLWKTLRQLETSIYPAVNGYLFRIREGQRMGTAFHQLCPRYNGPLTLTALVAVRLWETFTFFLSISISLSVTFLLPLTPKVCYF